MSQLTEHFSLDELTVTSVLDFKEMNRILAPNQILKLTELAQLLEEVRDILKVPLKINSGYRCPELNKIIGSNNKSQHLLCEAADFTPINLDIGEAFRFLWKNVKESKLKVGQLIFETAERAYGVTSWIHISLGYPHRQLVKCNQILRMENGKYSLLEESLT